MCSEDERIELAGRDLLIYNYEDQHLTDLFSTSFLDLQAEWFGTDRGSTYALVLRDPFNHFASNYKWAISGRKWPPPLDWVTSELSQIWKSYAKEFLGYTHAIPEPKVCINYNNWFTNDKYRHQIAQFLALDSSDKGLTEVAKWGPNTWGDSFDNLNFEGRANEMKVLERWRYFADDKVFVDLFRDPELLSLSEKIFGVIPGTDVLYAQLSER